MLRRVSDMQGCKIHASDGEIGSVDQWFFDDETWIVRYLVVDTGNWLRGRQVLISPVAFGDADVVDEMLNLSITKEQIENGPGIDTNKPVSSQREGDPHLRSTKEVIGYYIEAKDGDIGHVQDFIVDNKTWAIRFIVVDTVNWWPDELVVIAPQWIERVSWEQARVFVDLTRESIKQAPKYDATALVNGEYEPNLYDHYGRSKDWVEKCKPVVTASLR